MTHKKHVKKVKKYYNNFAPGSMKLQGELADFRLNLLRHYIKQKDTVLDGGCGNGAYSIPLSETGCNITWVDFSKYLLAEFKGSIRERKMKNMDNQINSMQNSFRI